MVKIVINKGFSQKWILVSKTNQIYSTIVYESTLHNIQTTQL